MNSMFEMECRICNFRLYHCIIALEVSTLAFVDDHRYPGRCILGLQEHAEAIDIISDDVYEKYMKDLREAVRAIRLATECDRVNVYLLGNREPHLHFHLVPRIGSFTNTTPPTHFEDRRIPHELERTTRDTIITAIRRSLS